ncbi:hypothetical protein HDV03_005306 [Kappamyces sp. JEL0829]|nr:hypothetical protein HDV03_005306 [Kappamyces sp. JEL0829]KAJ3365889.1 hypothetical protein HDU91_002044 [Kappamyces sp. JEL0680]
MVSLYSTFVSLVSVAMVAALPNGAPKCGINETAIQQGMIGASDATLGYSLNVVPAGNNMWNITIDGKRTDYQGILMYVHQIDTPKVHLGQFSFKNQTKWKYQPLDLCNTGGITSSTPMSTMTHATPDRVALAKKVTFQWTASAQELALNGLVVNAVVAVRDDGVNSGKAKWQHLSFVGIPPTPNGGTTAGSTTPGTAGTTGTTGTNSTGTSGTGAAATHTVSVGASGLVYTPDTVNANVGDMIMWNFGSSHSVTQSAQKDDCAPMAGGFDSGVLGTGSYMQTITAAQAGSTIWYYCTVGQHCQKGMKGSIVVSGTAPAGTTPATTKSSATSTFGGLAMVLLLSLLSL